MEYPKSNLDTEVPDDAFTFDPEKKDRTPTACNFCV